MLAQSSVLGSVAGCRAIVVELQAWSPATNHSGSARQTLELLTPSVASVITIEALVAVESRVTDDVAITSRDVAAVRTCVGDTSEDVRVLEM